MNSNPRLRPGDIVSHFKRYSVDKSSNKYLYKIVCIAQNQNAQKQVVYQALYAPFGMWIRDYDEFMGKLSSEDHEKHPGATQEYRFEFVAPAVV